MTLLKNGILIIKYSDYIINERHNKIYISAIE